MVKTKQEFIDCLRRALTGRISADKIEEHIRYYEDYITAETRIKGSERAVLDMLGDPKLIAISICAAGEAADERTTERYTPNDDLGECSKSHTRDADRSPFLLKHPKLFIFIIVAVIIIVVFLLIALAFSLLKLFWPVLVVILAVVLLVRLIAYFRQD